MPPLGRLLQETFRKGFIYLLEDFGELQNLPATGRSGAYPCRSEDNTAPLQNSGKILVHHSNRRVAFFQRIPREIGGDAPTFRFPRLAANPPSAPWKNCHTLAECPASALPWGLNPSRHSHESGKAKEDSVLLGWLWPPKSPTAGTTWPAFLLPQEGHVNSLHSAKMLRKIKKRHWAEMFPIS